MFTKPANLQQATSRAPGHQGAHRPKTALARAPAAATCSGRTTTGNGRPLLRRAALAAAATGAAAMLALGPSTPSSAAAIPIVNTTDQAGYQAGGHTWNFRYVQAVVKLPNRFGQQFGCPDSGSLPNYLESSLQLIRPEGAAGFNAAIGIFCEQAPRESSRYRLGWVLDYEGNTHPKLVNVEPEFIAGGETVLMKLYYNQGSVANLNDQTLQFRACKTIPNSSSPPPTSKCPAADDPDPFHLNLLDHTEGVPRTFYKQAVLSANVANPLPHPPVSLTGRRFLMPFTEADVTNLNPPLLGSGIQGPWGVQQENELAADGSLVAKPHPLSLDGKAFNIFIYG
jgi:hypothetical protein